MSIKLKKLLEQITIPVEIGDTILTGRFKNKKTKVKSIGEDEHGMPTINGRKVVTFRFPKKEKTEESTKLSGIIKEDKYVGLSIKELLDQVLDFKKNTIIFFDLETMGISPRMKYLQVTEIAAIAYDGKTMKELERFNYKVKLDQAVKNLKKKGTWERKMWDAYRERHPKEKFKEPEDVLRFTRYGKKTAPYIMEIDAISKLFKFFDKFKNPILVAHNASFDLRFIYFRSNKYYGMNFKKHKSLDTLELVRLYFQPLIQAATNSEELDILNQNLTTGFTKAGKRKMTARLGDMAKAMGINPDEWHNAQADVDMLMQVTSKMIDFFKKYKNVDIDKFHRQAAPRYTKPKRLKR